MKIRLLLHQVEAFYYIPPGLLQIRILCTMSMSMSKRLTCCLKLPQALSLSSGTGHSVLHKTMLPLGSIYILILEMTLKVE